MSDPTPLLRPAIARRAPLLAALHAEQTDCYRLLHGAVEGAPGLAVDRYGPVLLVQTWREPLAEGVPDQLLEHARQGLSELGLASPERVVWNHRPRDARPTWPPDPEPVWGQEQGLRFDVRPRHRGRDPLLFLDLRAGRRWIRGAAEGRSVLNLFAYTCGVGLAAAAGGAAEVWNVDFASSALDVGRRNGVANGLDEQRFVQEDFFPVVRQLAGLKMTDRRGGRQRSYTRLSRRTFDLVVLDPPRWATSAFGTVDLVRDYPSLLKPALLATAGGGELLLTNNVASVDREAWQDVCLRCSRKAGRPIERWDWLVPEADFPSPDNRPPLKMAVATVQE